MSVPMSNLIVLEIETKVKSEPACSSRFALTWTDVLFFAKSLSYTYDLLHEIQCYE